MVAVMAVIPIGVPMRSFRLVGRTSRGIIHSLSLQTAKGETFALSNCKSHSKGIIAHRSLPVPARETYVGAQVVSEEDSKPRTVRFERVRDTLIFHWEPLKPILHQRVTPHRVRFAEPPKKLFSDE